MIRVTAAAFGLCLALASCTQMQRDEAVACASALNAARVSTLADLFAVAQATPACMALGLDAMQIAVRQVAAARGIR